MRNETKARRICAGLLLIYGLVMVWLLFLQREPSALPWQYYLSFSHNLIPFYTIRQQLSMLDGGSLIRFAVINLAGNVIMFVPLGLLPAVWKKQRRFGWYMMTVAVLIVLIEVLQLVTMRGSADIDDWMLNMLGAIIGFGIWRIWLFLSNKHTHSRSD